MSSKPVPLDDHKENIRKRLNELCEEYWIAQGYKKAGIKILCEKNTRLNIRPIGYKDTGVFISYGINFYFCFVNRNIFYCLAKTILHSL